MCDAASVHYSEQLPPPALDGLVKAVWTLDCDGAPDDWIERDATPDGCIELIRRHAGRSIWGGEQPECFACGLIDRPASFAMSGDARFSGIRFRPWAWNALGLAKCASFVDGWIDSDPLSIEEVAGRLAGHDDGDLGRAILTARSVEELARLSGRPHRRLQRWFAQEVGVPPRRYLRLLRFQEALATVQRDAEPLAAHAAEHGFADQAHMAREFRLMAGAPGSAVRDRARGPFV